jgi:hypothetical protein
MRRDESQSLVQQLTELQGRYDNLQTEQRNSLLNVAVLQQFQQEHQQQQVQNQHQQEQQKQLSACLQRLQDIQSALRSILRANSNSVRAAHGYQSRPRSRSCSPQPKQQQQRQRSGALGSLSLAVPLFEPEAVQGVPLLECAEEGSEGLGHSRPSSKGDIPSHRIETVSTRFFDSISSRLTTAAAAQAVESVDADAHHSLAAAAEEAAAAARMTHVEFVLAELQELMPLVKAAAEAALRAAKHSAGGAVDGQGLSGYVGGLDGGQQQQQQPDGLQWQPSALQTGSTADNSADKQQDQAAHTREAKVSLAGECDLWCKKKHQHCDQAVVDLGCRALQWYWLKCFAATKLTRGPASRQQTHAASSQSDVMIVCVLLQVLPSLPPPTSATSVSH